MFQYDMLARSLASGNGYRWYAQPDLYLVQPFLHVDLSTMDYDPRGVLTSFRPPFYPVFLAMIYFIVGTGAHRFLAVRLVQAFFGAALAPMTYALARRFIKPEPASPVPHSLSAKGGWGDGSEKAARVSAWIVACYPMLLLYPLSLATENLFFLLVLASTLTLLKAADAINTSGAEGQIAYKRETINHSRHSFNRAIRVEFFRARWFILSGVLLGLLVLTRSVALIFVGLAVLWVWLLLRQHRMAVIVLLGVMVVTLPWIVRNSFLHHRLVGIETTLGYNLYVGYHPEGNGSFHYPQSLDLLSILDDGMRDQVGMQKAWEFIEADPERFPNLLLRRIGYFFGLERRALEYFYSNNFLGYIPTPLLLTIATVLLLPFVLVSVSMSIDLALTRWNAASLLVASFLVGQLIPHALILSEDRFHLACVPFFAIFAAQLWVGGWNAVKLRWQTHTGKIAVILAFITVGLLLFNWGFELWRDSERITQLLGPTGNQTYFPY